MSQNREVFNNFNDLFNLSLIFVEHCKDKKNMFAFLEAAAKGGKDGEAEAFQYWDAAGQADEFIEQVQFRKILADQLIELRGKKERDHSKAFLAYLERLANAHSDRKDAKASEEALEQLIEFVISSTAKENTETILKKIELAKVFYIAGIEARLRSSGVSEQTIQDEKSTAETSFHFKFFETYKKHKKDRLSDSDVCEAFFGVNTRDKNAAEHINASIILKRIEDLLEMIKRINQSDAYVSYEQLLAHAGLDPKSIRSAKDLLVKTLEDSIALNKGEGERLDSQKLAIEKQLTHNKEELEGITTENSSLQAEHAPLKKQYDLDFEALRKLDEKQSALYKQIEKVRADLKSKKGAFSEKAKKAFGFKSGKKITSTEEALKHLESEIRKTEKERLDIQGRTVKANHRITIIRKRQESLTEERKRLMKEGEPIQRELETIQRDSERVASRLRGMGNNRAQLLGKEVKAILEPIQEEMVMSMSDFVLDARAKRKIQGFQSLLEDFTHKHLRDDYLAAGGDATHVPESTKEVKEPNKVFSVKNALDLLNDLKKKLDQEPLKRLEVDAQIQVMLGSVNLLLKLIEIKGAAEWSPGVEVLKKMLEEKRKNLLNLLGMDAKKLGGEKAVSVFAEHCLTGELYHQLPGNSLIKQFSIQLKREYDKLFKAEVTASIRGPEPSKGSVLEALQGLFKSAETKVETPQVEDKKAQLKKQEAVKKFDISNKIRIEALIGSVRGALTLGFASISEITAELVGLKTPYANLRALNGEKELYKSDIGLDINQYVLKTAFEEIEETYKKSRGMLSQYFSTKTKERQDAIKLIKLIMDKVSMDKNYGKDRALCLLGGVNFLLRQLQLEKRYIDVSSGMGKVLSERKELLEVYLQHHIGMGSKTLNKEASERFKEFVDKHGSDIKAKFGESMQQDLKKEELLFEEKLIKPRRERGK